MHCTVHTSQQLQHEARLRLQEQGDVDMRNAKMNGILSREPWAGGLA